MRLFLLCCFTASLSAGFAKGPDSGDDEIYLNAHMEVISNKKEATYMLELIEETEHGFYVKAHFLTGELKMEGYYSDEELQIPNGTFTYYHQNGEVESKGEFRDGSKFGLWERYDFEGNERPEKIYATLQMMQAIEAFK